MALVACQEEIEPEVTVGMDGIVSGNPVAQAIVNVSTNDGSADNIIDRSSCTTVIFPVTGVIDNETRVFSTLEAVQALGALALEVEWVFPLNVILADHTTTTLASEEALEAIQDNCIEGGGDADNECIDFGYPFTVQVFNTRTENTGTLAITSDKDTYNTFTSVNLIATIEYPINMVDAAGNFVQVATNETLLSVITGADNTCNEQDIIAFEGLFSAQFRAILTAAQWQVSYFEEDETVNTELFTGYSLQFNENLTMTSLGLATTPGEWDIELLDAGQALEVDLNTEDEPLVLLNEDWTIVSFTQTQITLVYQDGDDEVKRLELTAI